MSAVDGAGTGLPPHDALPWRQGGVDTAAQDPGHKEPGIPPMPAFAPTVLQGLPPEENSPQDSPPDEQPDKTTGRLEWWRRTIRTSEPEAVAASQDQDVEARGRTPTGTRGRRAHGPVTSQAVARARLRRWSYTLSAGALGCLLGGEHLLNGYLTDYAVQPGAAAALLGAGVGTVVAWQAAPHLSTVLPLPRPIVRFAGAGTAYEAIWGLRGDLNAWLARFGPLPGILAPLAVGSALTALAWHLIDRRTRQWWAPAAWAARVPTATCGLAVLLYAPGTAFRLHL